MELLFWQNILSPHQSAFLRALAAEGHSVTVVASEAMEPDRAALGWQVPDMGQARVVVDPLEETVLHLITSSSKDSIHVLAGARWTPLGNLAARQCLELRRRVGIMSEAPDPRGIPGWGRWIKYTTERYARGYRYDFLLGMGEMGVRWFRSCGYSVRKSFPFTYVTEPAPSVRLNGAISKIVLLFVGQFIVRKGLDLLLHALAGMPLRSWELRLLGDGPEKTSLQRLAQELGIQDRVTWLAKRDVSGVQMEMKKADVTILASRHDGWGAVVNESLMAGTPVVCSTACGAADLIRQPWLGTVFRSGSVPDLTKALHAWIERGNRSDAERERIRTWANCISGETVARYFAAIVEHVYSAAPRPVAEWRS